MTYLNIIYSAIMFFPLIAFFISIPFILTQYHKYGSISFLKVIIIYSFTLYLLSIYFLVILPLPSKELVMNMTTPRTQLIPFNFFLDFFKNTSFNISNVHTYFIALKEPYFYVPFYNLLLTLPFGIYLRYYFKCNLLKTTIYTFLLSLFFEITQLTGLYFIYPRGYRLFDVDDLILNTIGGILGFLVIKPLLNKLPKREEIDLKAKEKGKNITGFRRTTTFFLDLFIFFLIYLISFIIFKKYNLILVVIIYYYIIPIFLDNSTLGQKFLNSKVIDYHNHNNNIRLLLRRIIFILMYIGIPLFIIKNLKYINSPHREIIILIVIFIIIFTYIITFIKYLFTSKDMIYEKLSKTKLISTIK